MYSTFYRACAALLPLEGENCGLFPKEIGCVFLLKSDFENYIHSLCRSLLCYYLCGRSIHNV